MRLILVIWIYISVATVSASGFLAPQKAQKWMKSEGAVLLDVREENELKAGGLAEGATWIAMSEIRKGGKRWESFKKNLPKNKKVIVYCAAGGRASRVGLKLKALGFDFYNLGGFRDWQSAGLPVTKFNK